MDGWMDGQFFPFRSPSGPRSLAAAPGWRCSITCESGRTFSFGKNGNAHTHEAGRPTRVFRLPAPFCPRTEWCPGLSRIHQPIPALRYLQEIVLFWDASPSVRKSMTGSEIFISPRAVGTAEAEEEEGSGAVSWAPHRPVYSRKISYQKSPISCQLTMHSPSFSVERSGLA